MKVEITQNRCKECGLCIHHCPKKAIRAADQINVNGYHPALIDDERCTACGICYIVCPDGVFHVLGSQKGA